MTSPLQNRQQFSLEALRALGLAAQYRLANSLAQFVDFRLSGGNPCPLQGESSMHIVGGSLQFRERPSSAKSPALKVDVDNVALHRADTMHGEDGCLTATTAGQKI